MVPSRRSVLLEVHEDTLLRICLYYVFNDCTKTSSTRVTGRIQLQRGLVYVTSAWNPGPRNSNLFTILIVNRNNIFFPSGVCIIPLFHPPIGVYTGYFLTLGAIMDFSRVQREKSIMARLEILSTWTITPLQFYTILIQCTSP